MIHLHLPSPIYHTLTIVAESANKIHAPDLAPGDGFYGYFCMHYVVCTLPHRASFTLWLRTEGKSMIFDFSRKYVSYLHEKICTPTVMYTI